MTTTAPTKIIPTVAFSAPKLRVVGKPQPTPRRLKNEQLRPREYLTPAEVETLIATAKKRGRYGQRDAVAILVCYRHGLRVSELCGLRWDQINFDTADINIRRAKGGKPAVHPLSGLELRELRRLRREWPEGRNLIQTERGGAMTPDGFAKMLARVGVEAGFEWAVHPHMLRHACGFKLANDARDTRAIQDYLGHRSIQSTVRYTELASSRFVGLWQD
jgi:type 1 fimbriae regulatory protein FimB/type 1 fimbriae regulatory protein FimE